MPLPKGHKIVLVAVSPGGLHYDHEYRSMERAIREANMMRDNGDRISEFHEVDASGRFVREIAPQWMGAYRRTGRVPPAAARNDPIGRLFGA